MTALAYLQSQRELMIERACRWSNQNSGSRNPAGLATLSEMILDAFTEFLKPDAAERRWLGATDKPGVPMLVLRKRPAAPCQVFLFGHLDTVFGPEHPFQTVTPLEGDRIRGPGLCDMKGGLVILLHGLAAYERFVEPKRVGWTVAINADEEVGSPASSGELVNVARNHHFAFGFEPALASGALASQRRGSGTFLLRFHGRAAHSGRNPRDGRNALVPLARFVLHCEELNAGRDTIFLNPAEVTGGIATNIVPDLATCRINVRTSSADDERWVHDALHAFIASIHNTSDYRVELEGRFTAPPKALTPEILKLIELARQAGHELGIEISAEPTGGTCDGNRLAAAGIPNLDNLGVRGGNLHSAEEFIYAASLPERAQLLFTMLRRVNDAGHEV
jgi:glutamate carboxypeptidase